MSSTTTSEEVLRIKGLNLAFRLRYYEQRALRSVFVETLRDPLGAVARSRDSLHVLKDLNLTLRKGDRLAVLGVNGSGKTTLCRCIAGILQPGSGEITVSGDCRAIFNTQIGFVPELTGRENARLLARLLYPKESDASLSALVEETMSFSELGDFLNAPFETYSQGMKARLSLSLATARPCALLVLDEVYDSTDFFFQRKMSARMKGFIHQSEAVIFVSHSPAYLREVCNRAVILHQSRIVYDGTVERALRVYEGLHGKTDQKGRNEPDIQI